MHLSTPLSITAPRPANRVTAQPPATPVTTGDHGAAHESHNPVPPGIVIEMLEITSGPARMLDEIDGRRNPRGGYDVCGPSMPGRGACEPPPTPWQRFVGLFTGANRVAPATFEPEAQRPGVLSRLLSSCFAWLRPPQA